MKSPRFAFIFLTIGASFLRSAPAWPGMLPERTFRIVRVGANHGVGSPSTEKPDAEVRYTGTRAIIAL